MLILGVIVSVDRVKNYLSSKQVLSSYKIEWTKQKEQFCFSVVL